MEARKINLIREYFKCRYEFAKLHNSETNFREEPTDNDIANYSKFPIISTFKFQISCPLISDRIFLLTRLLDIELLIRHKIFMML